MSLSNIKVNNSNVIGVDDIPSNSENLIKSKGVNQKWELPSFKTGSHKFDWEVNADLLFKYNFIQGVKQNQVEIVPYYGFGHNGEKVYQSSFFIVYIDLMGNEKNITALSFITLGGYPYDESITKYPLDPLFVFYDSNDEIIDLFNGIELGKFITAEIPDNCVRIGVNCGIDNIFSNRITLRFKDEFGPEPEPEPEPYKPILNILGDSITIQGMYTNALVEFGYRINNYGVSGTCITTIRSNNFRSRVSSMSDVCDAIIVFGGINDWQLGAPLGTKYETTDESKFYPALNELFIALRNKYVNKPIFVCTPLHSQFSLSGYSDKFEYSEINNQITANVFGNGDILSNYVQAIKDIAQLYSIQVIDTYSESGLAALIPSNKTAYYQDGLHPNAAGGVLIAKCIHNALGIL